MYGWLSRNGRAGRNEQVQMDTGNDYWTQSLDSVGKGEDSDICTTNSSLRGQPLIRSDHRFSCRGWSSVSRPLIVHLLEIYAFKVLATNSNVRYNTGQQIVGQTEYLLKLGVAQRLLVSTSVPQELPSKNHLSSCFLLSAESPEHSAEFTAPFTDFTHSLWESLKLSFLSSHLHDFLWNHLHINLFLIS